MTEPVRLAKRVAELRGCSRREAEQYIEGGWVTVDGLVVQEPQSRVSDQEVLVDPNANLMALTPVTLLLHKTVGCEAGLGRLPDSLPAAQWLTPANFWPDDRSGLKPLKKHFQNLTLMTPLAPRASGLVVFTQDWRIGRKLQEDAQLMEHEVTVEVSGVIRPGGLERLNRVDHGLRFNGQLLGPAKVSWQSENRLRFALKGELPGQIAYLCESMGLQVQGMKRLRVGRVGLNGLAVGQWRYLLPQERF